MIHYKVYFKNATDFIRKIITFFLEIKFFMCFFQKSAGVFILIYPISFELRENRIDNNGGIRIAGNSSNVLVESNIISNSDVGIHVNSTCTALGGIVLVNNTEPPNVPPKFQPIFTETFTLQTIVVCWFGNTKPLSLWLISYDSKIS